MNSRYLTHIRGKRACVIVMAKEAIIAGNAGRVTARALLFRQGDEVTLEEMRRIAIIRRARRICGLKEGGVGRGRVEDVACLAAALGHQTEVRGVTELGEAMRVWLRPGSRPVYPQTLVWNLVDRVAFGARSRTRGHGQILQNPLA